MVALGASAAKVIAGECHRLRGTAEDFEPLLEAIGEKRIVLLGEASHGTHEFYEARGQITRALVEKKGFNAIAVEGDWPDAYRVNRYVRGTPEDGDAPGALAGFARFPQWMWRNEDVVRLVEWLKRRNAGQVERKRKCGFYGMDLYSLYSSMEAVLRYLDKADPAGAKRARLRYACFEPFEQDAEAYGQAASFQFDKSCEDEAVAQLKDLQRRSAELVKHDGQCPEDEYFYAEQNARLVMNAEAYYRQLFGGRVDTWNLRDTHMVETIGALRAHLDRTRGEPAKMVVWAHNSHVGDARATEMRARGELNVGQLCREQFGEEVFIAGFTTHEGVVTAATDWGGRAQFKRIRASLESSAEYLFHETGVSRFLLLTAGKGAAEVLASPRLERFIGVIYRPETERQSHYFHARVGAQFDAVVHVDVTGPVLPLEQAAPFELEKAETFPSGV